MSNDKKRRIILWSAAAAIAFAAVATRVLAQAPPEQSTPNIQFNIPTVHFSPSANGGTPYIAQYVNGVYEYASSIASFLAGVMLIIGGFQYLTGQVAEGKKRIQDAIIGLLIVIFAYTILNTINPGLIQYNPVRLQKVANQALDIQQFGGASKAEIENPQYLPPTPAIAGAPYDGSAKYKISLDASIPAGIDLYGTSPRLPKPPKDAAGIPGPGMESAQAVQQQAQEQAAANGGDTNAADTSSKPTLQPGLTTEQSGVLVDLYRPNEYGVQVRGETPTSRAHSVCVGPANKYPPAKSKEEVMKRAAAIVRVWIIESMIGAPKGKELGGSPGAVYVRHAACPGASPEFAFGLNAYKNSLAGCMQPFLALPAEASEFIMNCPIGTCQKLAYQIAHPSGMKPEEVKAQAQEKSDALNCRRCLSTQWEGSFSTGYSACWANPACKAGFLTGDCTGFALDMIGCALGPGWLNKAAYQGCNPPDGMCTATTGATVAFKASPPIIQHVSKDKTKEIKDPQAWIDVMKSNGGPQFLDLYHGCMDCSGPHTFTYVGGMGLKTTKGQLIYWLEMGGGGVFDTRLQGTNQEEGWQGYAFVPGDNDYGAGGAGGGGIGIKLHYVPSIVTMSAYDGQMYYYRTVDKYMNAHLTQ